MLTICGFDKQTSVILTLRGGQTVLRLSYLPATASEQTAFAQPDQWRYRATFTIKMVELEEKLAVRIFKKSQQVIPQFNTILDFQDIPPKTSTSKNPSVQLHGGHQETPSNQSSNINSEKNMSFCFK